ncbi:hypothetical protein QJS10_CPB15g01369 [Acorus calamus]|uniref:Complex 1 LYR protein domain-containing protein n=1 Tax=Acorus calamus TaxID=4465 RepID=A0AAV9D5F8_ACOCL|nr:hypothetical protein QJS10_CPB15g01369 [Acorus calamus]
MASTPSRGEILSLFRSLLKTASKFSDYNIREYVKRRTIDAFRDNKTLSDPNTVCSAFMDGKTQLEIARRQSIVYSLYAPKAKNIMEIKSG